MKVIIVAAPIRPAMMISSSRSRILSNMQVPRADRAARPAANPAHFIPSRRARPKQSPASVHRAAAGLLQELVDQRLTDPRGHVLVDRHHCLAHRLVLLSRQRDDLGLAGLLN